jgi:23S rRNA (cytidine1920-2'-O)/16S rRNA (cytidine1409-2'-O)-methyltransferase
MRWAAIATPLRSWRRPPERILVPGERADLFLVKHGFATTRAEAQAAIRAGHVSADGAPIAKASQRLTPEMAIAYAPAHPYVSRGALKLAAALDQFTLSPAGKVCLDIGASTGGFSEVLLLRGAARVYAIDVGHGQLHPSLAADPRVIAKEGVNVRALGSEHVPELVGAVVADVSFISLRLALPAALARTAPDAWAVLLVKPQFEVGREGVSRGGIVRDEAAQAAVLGDIAAWMAGQGWSVIGTMDSPILGGDGNREFLLGARRP